MKPLFTRSAAALLIAAAALTAACSNNDPTAPAASAGPNATRTSTIGGPVHASGYAVGWGRDSSTTISGGGHGALPTAPGAGPAPGGALPTGGYAVGWGRGDEPMTTP